VALYRSSTAALCSHNIAVEWVEILHRIWEQDIVAGFIGLTHSFHTNR